MTRFNVGDTVRSNQPGFSYTATVCRIERGYLEVDCDKGSGLDICGWRCRKINGGYATADGAWDDVSKLEKIKGGSKKNMAMTTGSSMSGFGGGMSMPSMGSISGGKFKDGDRVTLTSGRHGVDDSNPVWGEDGQYIVGTVNGSGGSGPGWFNVEWDNGRSNVYEVRDLAKYDDKKKKGGFLKKIKLDTSQLDALVIDDEKKRDIIAVLDQHQHQDKLFNEWGLGEVIEYGRGMSFMFHGGPGTGKTWAAHRMAKALNCELLTLDASNIQTSEPGGANRNIQQAFETAKEEGKILFIDECDSLIFNRANLGMILGSEVNTLLTEIEKSEGVVILATNRITEMDPALERRISMIIEFPEPDYEMRQKIWGVLLPKKMPLAKDVSVEDLAKKELTGGIIKNIVLQAARFALADKKKAVDKEHFNRAIDRAMSSKNLMGSSGSRMNRGGTDKVASS